MLMKGIYVKYWSGYDVASVRMTYVTDWVFFLHVISICLSFVIDADDARDKMNDDGDETPGMLHVLLLSLFSYCILTVFLLW